MGFGKYKNVNKNEIIPQHNFTNIKISCHQTIKFTKSYILYFLQPLILSFILIFLGKHNNGIICQIYLFCQQLYFFLLFLVASHTAIFMAYSGNSVGHRDQIQVNCIQGKLLTCCAICLDPIIFIQIHLLPLIFYVLILLLL